ncbi:AraC family transcriptional regulator with amidase-like domain [Rhodobacter aestuarii]|uniref:Transcriptional regulator, AraC family with amidase-like domain n=1 Tax=Rhodobacter aestuarii TaxID=453582 RepID=A0A1N7JT95_9RHOB|nr:transcriptional regulator FtrA [Rhodobacter aestuarii]PTV96001.1 AraC family transcriptional regulator with amidase-like domain [Rhodobacter aestuarii]SIS52424.1 transcriptional regulator, AraC family with amidase-like domain [Rhodobacter aestuarii]
MTTIVQNLPNLNLPPIPNNRVVALAYDGLCIFEFGIVAEIFGLARPEMGPNWYAFATAAIEPGPLRAHGGLTFSCDGGLELLEEAGLIVVPGWKGLDVPVPAGLITALQNAHAKGARLASICSGAFVLAATGLLDGRRATTHWRYGAALADRFPKVQADPDVLFIDEGDILTSAGSAAGMDLGLHIIRRDFGAEAANLVARRLVMPASRDGGQAQFLLRPVPRDHEAHRLSPILSSLRDNLQETPTAAQLAAKAGLSERTFLRRFHEATGTTPARYLTEARLARAAELLETSRADLEAIAHIAGFASAAALRRPFHARYGLAPSDWRRRFARSSA